MHLRRAPARVRAPFAQRCTRRRDVLRRGVVPEDDAADREAPPAEPEERVPRAGRSRRPRGTSAARTSSRACRPCPPTRTSMRRAPAIAERDRRRPRSSTSRMSTIQTTMSTATGRSCDEQRDRAGDEQHPVGRGVEDLAELAALVEVPGDVAVDPVGRAEHGEQDRGRDHRRSGPCQSSQRKTGHAAAAARREIRFGIVQTRDARRRASCAQRTGYRPDGAAFGAWIGAGAVAGIERTRSRARCPGPWR